MIGRVYKVAQSPVKNQELSISYKGKTYAICEQTQMDYLIQCEKERLMMEAYDYDKKLAPEDLEAKIKVFIENCGYSTLKAVIEKMTPDERKAWEMSYRFAPIMKNI